MPITMKEKLRSVEYITVRKDIPIAGNIEYGNRSLAEKITTELRVAYDQELSKRTIDVEIW